MSKHTPEKLEGHPEFRELRRKTPLREYPWGTIATNVGGIAVGAGLGHLAAGAVLRTPGTGPLRGFFSKLTPAQRAALGTGLGAVAAGGALTSLQMSRMAGQARVAEEMARRQVLREQGEKAASVEDVVHIYGLAMESE